MFWSKLSGYILLKKKTKWSSFQFINSAIAVEVTVFSMVPARVPEQDLIGLGWIM